MSHGVSNIGHVLGSENGLEGGELTHSEAADSFSFAGIGWLRPVFAKDMMSKPQSLPWRTFSLERQRNDRHVSPYEWRGYWDRETRRAVMGRGKSRV